MVIGIVGFCTINASAETYNDLTYVIEADKDITITGCASSATQVVIPSYINGYRVTKIGSNAFSDCSKLTDITISDNIRVIESNAFSGCTLKM